MADEIGRLTASFALVILTLSLVGAFLSIASTALVDAEQKLESVAESVESEESVEYVWNEDIGDFVSTDGSVLKPVATAAPVIVETPAPVAEVEVVVDTFNNNFIHHGNPRVHYDEEALAIKAQSLFEDKAVQFYFVTVETKTLDVSDARYKAENASKKIKDDYAVILAVTDAGKFWFFGDEVATFVSAEDKVDLYSRFDNCYTVDEYKQSKVPLVVGIIFISVVILYSAFYYYGKYSLRKREIDAAILNAKLEEIDDIADLFDKFAE